jgi:hypothetical protein
MNPNAQLAKTLADFTKVVLTKFQEQLEAMQRLENTLQICQTKIIKMQCSLDLMDIQDPTPEQFDQWLKSKNEAAEELVLKYQETIKTNMQNATDMLKSFFKNMGSN